MDNDDGAAGVRDERTARRPELPTGEPDLTPAADHDELGRLLVRPLLPIAQQRRRGLPAADHLPNGHVPVLSSPAGQLLGEDRVFRLAVDGRKWAVGGPPERESPARADRDEIDAAGRRLIEGMPERGVASG